ncbi:MAG: DNA translocase FtsK 4TM domain-containing protein, partial [Acidimicrobiales bacterium]
MWAVVAGHATDLWGVVLVTVGVLAAVAFYGGSLGPAGHGARVAVGDLLGWGRFLVPPVAVAVGILLLVGRDGDEEGRAAPEPARAVIGASLTLLSVAGMAALAGGSPGLRASTASLSSAGGWVGALIGNPLRSAFGGFGAATVLAAVLVAATVVFTGVPVSSAAGAVARAARWSLSVARGGPGDGGEDEVEEDEPTDPFGRALATGEEYEEYE